MQDTMVKSNDVDNGDPRPIELDLEYGISYGYGGGGEGCQQAPRNHHYLHDRGHVCESDNFRHYFNDIAVKDDQDDDRSDEEEEDDEDDGVDDDDAVSDDDERVDASDDNGFTSFPSSSNMHNKKPRTLYQPASLLHLATKMVASNLEIINPGSIGLLSEYHWDAVVQERARNHKLALTRTPDKKFSKDGKSLPLIAMDGNSSRRLLPALSEKILIPIEQHPNNAHISKSKTADDLLWQEIVDYKFSGMNRPQSLEVPCGVVEERLRSYGDDLLHLMSCPMSEDEFMKSSAATESMKQRDHEEPEDEEYGEMGRKQGWGEVTDVTRIKSLETQNRAAATDRLYEQYLEIESQRRTNTLQLLLVRLIQTPMDVTLLAETDIGKRLNKCIKIMKKLLKVKKPNNNMENENFLFGYPLFWTPCQWGELYPQEQYLSSQVRKWKQLNTPLEVMQQIVQDWKEMASMENGVDSASIAYASTPAMTQSLGQEPALDIATCGRGKNISFLQHCTDMKLLHSSPDWRSLYHSLKDREGIVKKIQGDRVRSIRENLEKSRPKIGKVVLKKAVGRVRGRDDGTTSYRSSTMGNAPLDIDNVICHQSLKGQKRREAILSKSLGNRSRQQQLLARNGSPHSSNGKLSQIRSESKVAASWSKSSFSESSLTSSAFGSAVARACRNNGNDLDNARKRQRQGSQVHVELGNGKQMKLPPSLIPGSGKTVGVYSSLQKKMTQKRK